MWGKLPILKPKSTRRFIAGKEDTSWVAEASPKPVLSEADALVQLQTCVRALPRVFTEDEVPPQLRSALPRMEQLGIVRCTSRRSSCYGDSDRRYNANGGSGSIICRVKPYRYGA